MDIEIMVSLYVLCCNGPDLKKWYSLEYSELAR